MSRKKRKKETQPPHVKLKIKKNKEKKLKESREIETLYLYRNSKLNYTGVFSETMNLEESEVKYLKF